MLRSRGSAAARGRRRRSRPGRAPRSGVRGRARRGRARTSPRASSARGRRASAPRRVRAARRRTRRARGADGSRPPSREEPTPRRRARRAARARGADRPRPTKGRAHGRSRALSVPGARGSRTRSHAWAREEKPDREHARAERDPLESRLAASGYPWCPRSPRPASSTRARATPVARGAGPRRRSPGRRSRAR